MTPARELSDRLTSLFRNERNAMADFLVALATFDQQRAWSELGYPSLWAFLRHELKLSKGAAFHRKTAAELIQAYPAVADALRSGELCLSTVAELARALTPENAAVVLPRFFGLSHREAEALSASIRPVEVIPTRAVVRLIAPSVPTPSTLSVTPAGAPIVPAPPGSERPRELALAVPVPTLEPQRPISDPPRRARGTTAFLDADRARISVTVPRRVLDKLDAARDALAHVIPGGNLADVIEHALDLVLAESRKKRALVERPRKAPKPPRDGSRHVPAEVARTVWKRSEGHCECLLPDGRRCDATRSLELDHVRPFALGGKATVDNLRVACRDCNQLAARRAFGDAVLDRYARRKDRSRGRAAFDETGRSGPAAPLPVPDALALFT